MWVLAGRELRGLFVQPLGWLLLALCQGVAAWWFLLLVERYRDRLESRVSSAQSPLGVTDLVLVPYFGGAPLLAMLVLLTAALSLRLVVQDRRQGTLALLLAAPPGAAALALGKYLGSLACAGLALGLWCLMPALLVPLAGADSGVLAACALGLGLTLAGLLAVGMLVSCLSEQPAVVAAVTTALGLVLLMLGRDGDGVLGALGLVPRLRGFLSGAVSSADLAYFGVLIIAPLALAALRLHEWRGGR